MSGRPAPGQPDEQLQALEGDEGERLNLGGHALAEQRGVALADAPLPVAAIEAALSRHGL